MSDVDAWVRFCAEIDARVMHARLTQATGAAFETPLPPEIEIRPLPVGRLRPLPVSPRDERGRFRRAE